MSIKKLIASAAVVISLTVTGIAASAETYTKDDATGMVTWDFTGKTYDALGEKNKTTYYKFTSSGIYTETTITNEPEDKDTLIIQANNGNGIGVKVSSSGGLVMTYISSGALYYKPTVNGILSVTGYAEKDTGSPWSLTMGETTKILGTGTSDVPATETINCTAGQKVTIIPTSTANAARSHITKITFTPTEETVYTFTQKASELEGKTLKVSYTDAKGENTVSKKLNSDNFPTFSGNFDLQLAVKIKDVPKTTTITGMIIE